MGDDLTSLVRAPVQAVWLAVFSAAIRRGESFARWWLGGGALLAAVWQLAAVDSADGEHSSLAVLLVIAFCAVPGWILLDGKAIEPYLREQNLHAKYRAKRARAAQLGRSRPGLRAG